MNYVNPRNRRPREKSALMYILKAFIPYSRESFELAFSPNRFFNELEKISNYKKPTLRSAMNRAKHRGYVQQSGKVLRLTEAGKRELEPYTAKRLGKHAGLMVVFDIPEQDAYLRRQLRLVLRQWRFLPVQKSVWMSRYDHRRSLVRVLKELKLENYVEVYESARLFPR